MSKKVAPEWSDDSPTRRSCMFYKLMVASILEDKKLKIPKMFVKKYGDELSLIVTFTVPSGQIWLVELQKVDDRIWFQNGWHEFLEYYSIRVGHFLVFRYEGKSNFNVYIFDLSVSEIKYSFGTLSCSQELGHDYQSYPKRHDSQRLLHHEKHDVTEILGSSSTLAASTSTRSQTFHGCGHCNWINCRNDGTSIEKLHIKEEVYDLGENFQSLRDKVKQFNGSELKSTADEVGLHVLGKAEGRSRRRKQTTETSVQKTDVIPKRMKITSGALTRRWRAVTTEERQKTIAAADMFKTDNPFCKHMPSRFIKKYLKGATGFIKLQVSDGKQWPARLVQRDGSAKLSQGWTEFVWANNLEEGDVCVFELINTEDIVLKVTIFRVLEEAAPVNQC